jgi:hypothetical protein
VFPAAGLQVLELTAGTYRVSVVGFHDHDFEADFLVTPVDWNLPAADD